MLSGIGPRSVNVAHVMTDRMPALFLSHGAPTLVDSQRWVDELTELAARLPRPRAILVASAHWEAAPITIGATDPSVPLTYDFGGFADRFYDVTYAPPAADALARDVAALVADGTPVRRDPRRRLDHGAYVPLTVMYPDADIPVLQVSLPTQRPGELLALGERLRPLRDEGVLIIGSGFTTHGLPFLRDYSADAVPPSWSAEFDAWARETMAAGDVDALADYHRKAPGMPYAHPTPEHFSPLFVTLGAASDPGEPGEQVVDGFWMGLAKRSLLVA